MTIPAKAVTGVSELLTSPVNITKSIINTAGMLAENLKDTGISALDLLHKNPLKKATRNAIGNKYKNTFSNFTTHQKKKFQEYTAPLQGKWDKTKRMSKTLGGVAHSITGAAELGVMTALDAGWRGVKTPFVGVANWFRKKDKKIHLWKQFGENQEKRVAKFNSGFAQLKGNEEKKEEKKEDEIDSSDKPQNDKEEEKEEVKEEKEGKENKEFIDEEIKRHKRNNNQKKEKSWQEKKEENKEEGKDSSDKLQNDKAEGKEEVKENNYKTYETKKMKDVLENKIDKYTEGDSSNFKILYPGSHTDVTPATVFNKDNVDFLDKNEKSMQKLSEKGYKAIISDLSDHDKKYDLVLEHRSQTKGENLAKNVKKGGYILVENAHAKGNYFDQSSDFEYIANLSEDNQNPYKRVREDNPISSGDANYYLFRKKIKKINQ